jgi:ABC-type transport system involved in multi-copper enzyme maturation permease subunit
MTEQDAPSESPESPAPSRPTDGYLLTERERRLGAHGFYLLLGAAASFGLAALLIALGILGAAGDSADLLELLSSVGANRFEAVTVYGSSAALLAGILALIGMGAALILAMAGVLAQEVWSLALVAGSLLVGAIGVVYYGFFPLAIPLAFAAYAGYRLSREIHAFRANPVMLKELRERMRGARAFVVITIYLGLMAGFAVLLYLIQRADIQDQGTALTGQLGRDLFAGVVGIEFLLIVFIAPAFTAGAVTAERERKTYDLLQITLLPMPSFIVGKLESALSYVFLLLLAAIPLQSIAFLFGGVSETELILAFIILAVTAVTLGAVGMFFSTLVDRTLTASVRAYTVAFIVVVGVPLVFNFLINIFNNAVVGTGSRVTSSPTLEAALIYLGGLLTSLNPIATAITTRELLVDRQTMAFWDATLSSDGSSIPLVSPWITLVIIYLIVSTVLILLAVRRLRRMEA